MPRTVVVLAMVLAMVATVPVAAGERSGTPRASLDLVVREVQQRLTHIAGVVQAAAAQAPVRSRDPEAMRSFLTARAAYVPHVLFCVFMTPQGVVTAVGPGYDFLKGTDLASQAWVHSVLKSRKPQLGRAFLSLEGLYAVAFVAPAMRDGRMAGLVGVVVNPAALLGEQVTAASQAGSTADVWVMEPSGRLLYDQDQDEVGKSLLDDPLYAPFPSIGEAARRIAAGRQGTTRLAWTPADTGVPLELTIAWQSVAALGTSWRVAAAWPASGEGSAARTLAGLASVDHLEALRQLAADPGLVEAVQAGAWGTVQATLGRYYARYPCYAVQWVDPDGLVRGGYPPGNALASYQLNPFENPFDAELLTRVQAQTEASFATPLAEGRRGMFHLVPVHAGETLIGMVYDLRVE
ncbi:MAG TPA: PDC sensor domain-containing protein [Thermoanaerobaculaceae bacterium]|nr:PDC sensor domain-containing protein [Thermoanaerobaculaceae bacterium]